MSAPSEFESKTDILEILINALMNHERTLQNIVDRLDALFERTPTGPREVEPRFEKGKAEGSLEGNKEGVIFIAGKKVLYIPEEELPKILKSELVKLVEYNIDTPEKKSALERLFSTLEKKTKK